MGGTNWTLWGRRYDYFIAEPTISQVKIPSQKWKAIALGRLIQGPISSIMPWMMGSGGDARSVVMHCNTPTSTYDVKVARHLLLQQLHAQA